MTLQQLKYIVAVEKYGSFGKAAEMGDPNAAARREKLSRQLKSARGVYHFAASIFALMCFFSGVIYFSGDNDRTLLITMLLHGLLSGGFLAALRTAPAQPAPEKTRKRRRAAHLTAAIVLSVLGALALLLTVSELEWFAAWFALWALGGAALAFYRAHRCLAD